MNRTIRVSLACATAVLATAAVSAGLGLATIAPAGAATTTSSPVHYAGSLRGLGNLVSSVGVAGSAIPSQDASAPGQTATPPAPPTTPPSSPPSSPPSTPPSSPPSTPPTTPPPSTGANVQPGPSNTGVPAGTTLTVYNGDLVITTAGATYSGLDIHGYVVVKAPNVTIKNSIIRGGTGPTGNGIVNDTTPSATNFLLEDSEIVPQYPVVNLDDIKGYNYTALRDNIHGSVDGLKMYGNNATVQDSWIHDLVTYAHDPAQNNGPSHSDGVQILSGTNLKVIGNTIEGQPNSSVIITQDNGPVSNVLIDSNWLSGVNQVATVKLLNKPLPSLSGITVTNNRFQGSLASACQILDSPAVSLVSSGNVIDATGGSAKLMNTASTS